MIGLLAAIVTDRRQDIAAERTFLPLVALQEMALDRKDHRDFAGALRTGDDIAVIAEIKRSSPSAGAIALHCDPAHAASEFERAGAAALSVLTEPRRFRGSFRDLGAARRACGLPVLCKDFFLDEYQVWKAAAFGADAVLLIAAILEAAPLRSLLELAHALGMAAMVEAHDEAQARRALEAGARIIGLNNRDLTTFAVDLEVAPRVCRSIPMGPTIVAESGYRNAADIARIATCGAHAVLVGEWFMRASDRAGAVRSLRSTVCSR